MGRLFADASGEEIATGEGFRRDFMIRFLREYLKVLIPLLLAMGCYRFLAVPWLEPRAVQRLTEDVVPVARRSEIPWWNHFFLEGSWQNSNPTVVRTEDAILLFQEWEPLAPDRWKVSPLTMIVPRGKRPMNKEVTADHVLFIENPEGAEIQFQDAFDLAGPPPPVVGGHLSGPVRIVGPSAEANQEDIWIETRDIHIDRKQLWTSQEVQLKLGGSRITGRDLSILLDQDLLSATEAPLAEESPFQGLDQLKMMYVDRVELDFPKGGMWSPKTSSGSKVPAKAFVTCQGSFHFDFHTAWADLNNGVQVVHQVEGQVEDHFSADQLRMQFQLRKRRPMSNDALWTIQRLEAQGLLHGEADRPGYLVQMDSPGMRTKAIGRRLSLDLSIGRLELSNQLLQPGGAEASRVYLEREGLQVWSPSLQFESADLANVYDTVPKDQHLGALYAAGPGTAQLSTQDGDQWKLTWANVLSLQPEGEEDLLTIDGSANAHSQRHGRFASEHMYVWLKRMTDAMKQQYRARYGDVKPNEVLADRLHAKGQVLLDSPTLKAQVDDMKVWMVYPFLTEQVPAAATTARADFQRNRGGEPAMHASQAKTGMSSPHSVMKANYQQPPNASIIETPFPNWNMSKVEPTPPLHVTGPVLRSRVVIEPEQTLIDDLEIEGGVTLIRNEDRARGTLPFTITGNQLKMNTAMQGMADVQILGTPAEIKMGGGLLTGPEVRFNQRDQLVWMDHPGTLIVPPELLLKPGVGSPGNGIQWVKPPRIDWRGGMNFDGRMARLDGGVSIEADMITGPDVRWLILGNAKTMEVELTQPVSMGTAVAGQTPVGGASELGQITLKHDVDIRGVQSNLAGNRVSVEELRIPQDLTIHFPTKQFASRGPGTVLSRRLGPKQLLQCINLVYSNGLRGSFETNEIEFQRNVEVLLGPIRNWEDRLNVEAKEGLRLDETLMTCEILRAYSTSNLSWNREALGGSSQASWELEAKDHVMVESRSQQGDLTVRAPKIQFASPQEMLRIYGTPYEHGFITMPGTKPGEPPAQFEFSYFEVYPKTMDKGAINLINASSGEANSVQSTSSPRDRGMLPAQNRTGTRMPSPNLPSPRLAPRGPGR